MTVSGGEMAEVETLSSLIIRRNDGHMPIFRIEMLDDPYRLSHRCRSQ